MLTSKQSTPKNTSLAAPIYNPKDFDENCIACIFRGFSFCLDFRTCIKSDTSCPRGIKVNNQTGCPIVGECPDFGYKGVGYLGEGAQYPMGGLSLDGKQMIKVPHNYPCYISLVNSRRNKVDFTVYGAPVNTTAFMMQINYPFNATNYTLLEFGKPYRIEKNYDITILYLGSIIDGNSTSLIEWKKIPDPASLQGVLTMASLLVTLTLGAIGLLM